MRCEVMFSNIKVICRLLVVTIIFTTIVLPPGAVFCSEIPQPLENQVVFQPQGENHPNLANGNGHLSINGETSVTPLSQELRVWEEALPDNLMENVPGPGSLFRDNAQTARYSFHTIR